MELFKKKKESEVSVDEIDEYIKAQFGEISKYMKSLDERVKQVEHGKVTVAPLTSDQMRIGNLEQAVIALDNNLNNLSNDHLMLKSVAKYRKEFKHLQPPLPNIKHTPAVEQEVKQPEPVQHEQVIEYSEEQEPEIYKPTIQPTPTQEPPRIKLPKVIK